jgi:chromosome segregation ATPase
MDSQNLSDIRYAIRALPTLKNRLERLEQQICEAEDNVVQLKEKYEQESRDIECLTDESFSATLLRLIGKYEGKLTKEMQEQLQAKNEYDKAVDNVNQLKAERDELTKRIESLKDQQRMYEAELEKRKKWLIDNADSDSFKLYNDLDKQINALAKQLVETDEAIRAASRAAVTAQEALQSLRSAEKWATYDVWTDNGIFSHMAKYNNIDQAQSLLNRLDSQLQDLRKELADVNLNLSAGFTTISGTTRAVDYWLDNIFTDLNVRSTIRNNQEYISNISGKIQSVISQLKRNKEKIESDIKRLEKNKEELLLTLNLNK